MRNLMNRIGILSILFCLTLAFVADSFGYMGDTYSVTAIDPTIYADTSRADVTGETIDLQTYTSCLFVVNVGATHASLSGSNYILFILQESSDGLTWTDVIYTTSIIGSFAVQDSGAFAKVDAAAEDSTCYAVGYRGTYRYVRVITDHVGTHAGPTAYGCEAILTKRFAGARP